MDHEIQAAEGLIRLVNTVNQVQHLQAEIDHKGNGRRFDSVGDRRLLDDPPIAGAPLWLSGLGGFICTRGSSASRRVTILSGSTSSYSG